MTEPPDRIGFVGIGRMGANMARCLHGRGLHVTSVYDRHSTTASELAAELHVHQAHTPAEVADRSSVIITVVSDDTAMRSIFSTHDHTSLVGNSQDRLFINCATLSPDVHREIEQLVTTRGGLCLEACMAGSITQARQGTLYLMCGGSPETYTRAKAILDIIGTTVQYIGRTGEAAKVKALVNMVMNSNTAALAEGLGLGAALGIDLTLLRDVFSQTGAASRVLETDGDDMQQRAHDCYFSATHAAKDSSIALDLARQVGLSLPVAEATLTQYQRLIALGKGELDKSAVAELTFADRTGSSLPGKTTKRNEKP
jgi:3-hydroxyisobutyrate dehydrogenase